MFVVSFLMEGLLYKWKFIKVYSGLGVHNTQKILYSMPSQLVGCCCKKDDVVKENQLQ